MGKWVRRALQETNDTPTSTFVLQNKSRKGMEGGRLRAQNVGTSLKVSRDIQAATPCQIIPTQREHRILIAKGLIAKARIKKSQIIKGPIIKVQIK